jgi:hypothetical protein
MIQIDAFQPFQMKSYRNSLLLSAAHQGKSYLANKLARYLIHRNGIKHGEGFFYHPYESGEIWPQNADIKRQIFMEERIKEDFRDMKYRKPFNPENVSLAALNRLTETSFHKEMIVLIDDDRFLTIPLSFLGSAREKKRNVLVVGLSRDMDPLAKDLFDYVFVGKLHPNEKKKVWEFFFSFMSFENFDEMHQDVTRKYGFLVLEREKNTMFWTNAESYVYYTPRDVRPLTSIFHHKKKIFPFSSGNTLELLNFDFRSESEGEKCLTPLKTMEILFYQVYHFPTHFAVRWVSESLIQKLHLEECKIGDNVGVQIAQALALNRGLKSLNLRGNFMSTKSAQAFAKALKQNTTLEKLNINCNQYKLDDWKLFISAIRKNKTLQIFFFASAQVKGRHWKDCRALAKAFKHNYSLFQSDLWNNSKNLKFADLKHRFIIFFSFIIEP